MRTFRHRNPFAFLSGSSRRDDLVSRYVLREHARGRAFAEVVNDPYVRNWSTVEQRARLLERPELVAALGENALEELRAALRSRPERLGEVTGARAAG